ncbi:MAG: hypothetical protein MAG581_00135 [Deltaproteobacteria bacterium]|jgi:hypothetical protein|nr:hypothetical protein [Deltaproteobacteria bacterium]
MIKNIFLLLLFSVLLTLTAAKYSFAKPAREKLTTAVTFGPVGLPIPGLRFHYRYSDLLSLNAGFSFMFAVGDFNAGMNLHIPISETETYLGAKKIFIYHLTGVIDLTAGLVGAEIGEYFVEGGMGFGRSKSDSESEKTELVILQVGWFF